MIYGYARVSTKDQNLDIQTEALKKAGCEMIRAEKISGTSTTGRIELALLLDFIRPGDVLIVTRIDRLARSIRDLLGIVDKLKAKGATLKAIEQSVDPSTPEGKAFLSMLGIFAEFEHSIRSERQREGIESAKRAGAYIGRGRPISIDQERIRERIAAGDKPTECARALGVSRSSIYRAIQSDNLSA